jgi:hypothetical protein
VTSSAPELTEQVWDRQFDAMAPTCGPQFMLRSDVPPIPSFPCDLGRHKCDGHDDQCESDFDKALGRWSICGCHERVWATNLRLWGHAEE